MNQDLENVGTLILGAGPYGLSIASFMSFLQMDYRVVGQPMAFWHSHMMDDLQMRSTLEHTCPSNPDGLSLLTNWVAQHVPNIEQRPLATLLPGEFRDFMAHFIEHFQIPIHADHAEILEKKADGFYVQLRSGKTIKAVNVVVALGPAGMENHPSWCDGLSSNIVLHSAKAADLKWEDLRILVIGGGQSAAEIAMKAAYGGAFQVDMAFRANNLVFNSMHSEFTVERKRRIFRVKHAYLYSEPEFRADNINNILPVSIEPHLKMELEAKVNLRPNCKIHSLQEDNGRVSVQFQDGTQSAYDRLIYATGYKPDLSRLPIRLDLQHPPKQKNGLPDLTECGESSTGGLFFMGAWAAYRFGPQSNFIYGSHQMVPRLIGRLARFSV